ncbi:MAG: molybdenum cofactor guanylyltransferase [Desulfovibrio sp.]|nr:molybdenum cofactor guanylyltransferase [Desulfovibrio sp.]
MSGWQAAGKLPAGVVLAGGTSRRMGGDKATLRLRGTNLLEHAASLVRALVGRVLVVGREDAAFPCLVDETPDLGPAGGIATALRHFGEACLVLSCDLPLMDAGTLRRLLAVWQKRENPETLAAVCRDRQSGLWEPLVAVYEPGFLPLLDAGLASGKNKIVSHLPENRVCFLDYGEDEALPFFNLNRPADLALLRRCLELSGQVFAIDLLLKQLEKENARLKKLPAEKEPSIEIPKEIN